MQAKAKSDTDKAKVFIRHDAHKRLKMLSVQKGLTMGELVESAIPYLENTGKMPENINENLKNVLKK